MQRDTEIYTFGIERSENPPDWSKQQTVWDAETYRAVAYGIEGLVDMLRVQGIVWRGLSYKYAVPLSTLVVKGFENDEATVCFITGECLASCFRIFRRKYENGTLEWVKDKYG